ncbi:MAG: hypothetical protein WDN45_12700 [Caulobacteraceae bacterium]
MIGENTKIDNLVQIAHNVRLGRNCLLAAHTGISGSCNVGDSVSFGGQAGIADHVNIGDPRPDRGPGGDIQGRPAGEMWAGTPARPIRRYLRERRCWPSWPGREKGLEDERGRASSLGQYRYPGNPAADSASLSDVACRSRRTLPAA